ncbi:hypothetical protein Tco_0495131, partial [Tanacetum coccineum]
EELEWEEDIPHVAAPHTELSPTSSPPLSGGTFEVGGWDTLGATFRDTLGATFRDTLGATFW